MSMLLGLIAPTAGSGSVLGHSLAEPSRYLSRVGALIERPAFYSGLSGRENLMVVATVGQHDAGRIGGLLELVGLEGRGEDRFGAYSLGMKQRLGIAAALLGDPELLILDEPANGLDPAGMHEMRELIRKLADGGRTVFVSSHILAELEQICDWFIIIDQGETVFQGTASDLMAGARPRLVVAAEEPQGLKVLRDRLAEGGHRAECDAGSLIINVDGTDSRLMAAEVHRAAVAIGVVLVELHTERMSLEERYLAITNGGPK
jgi:ABC-2 type transport system ATP-binding protein